MTRTFLCFPDPYIYGLGSSHRWSVEWSPLPEPEFGYTILECPDHDENKKSIHEGPEQSERA